MPPTLHSNDYGRLHIQMLFWHHHAFEHERACGRQCPAPPPHPSDPEPGEVSLGVLHPLILFSGVRAIPLQLAARCFYSQFPLSSLALFFFVFFFLVCLFVYRPVLDLNCKLLEGQHHLLITLMSPTHWSLSPEHKRGSTNMSVSHTANDWFHYCESQAGLVWTMTKKIRTHRSICFWLPLPSLPDCAPLPGYPIDRLSSSLWW